MDAVSDAIVAQVKNVKRMSLQELERIASEMRLIGLERQKAGIVLVKLRSGRGNKTSWLAVMAVDDRVEQLLGVTIRQAAE